MGTVLNIFCKNCGEKLDSKKAKWLELSETDGNYYVKIQMFTTQDNKQLEPHEIAELIKRLINLGYRQKDVAKKISKTAGYVSQMLSYATESPLIKEQVRNGNMNVSTVLQLQKEIPVQSERVEAVQKAAAKQEKAKTEAKELGTSKDNTKKVPKLSLQEVSGKATVVLSKAERLADKIIDAFDMGESVKVQMVKLINSYL